MNSWVEIDGKKYYAGNAPYGYFVTDLHTKSINMAVKQKWGTACSIRKPPPGRRTTPACTQMKLERSI